MSSDDGGGNELSVEIKFYSDHLQIWTGGGNTRKLFYSGLKKCLETEHLLLIKSNANLYQIVDKTGFTKGSLQEFKEFLLQKGINCK